MRTKVYYPKRIAAIFLGAILCGIRSVDGLDKIIIDTDAGSDDAVAILLALKSEATGHEVIAITCSYGNTDVENVVNNVLKILTVANRSDIPVYKGAERSFMNEYRSNNYFGSDGLGDFEFTQEIIAKVDESKHAAEALIEFAKRYPGEITLVSLGPSTNIATAIALEPSFLKYLKNHTILGSSVAGIGNIAPNVEFNFQQDPESNYMILNRTTSCVLVPWEVCEDYRVPQDWRTNVLGKINSTIVDFINKAERISLDKCDWWSSSDTMAIATVLWPELITKSVLANVLPVTDGIARGSVLVDYNGLTDRPKNARIVQSFNVTAFQQLVLEKFS
ncbi:probable uridine nucleosidase 2 [Ceratina calcarata]|uniref:Probable uridine nucleosidase 2 n=1 Tax=Ceratina calcarata TaxID=156304 RepID=A0AAJ7N3N5_9HYME|nr:probable uridine nucleosidase 2 [Ceratina calcarata]